MWACQPEDRTLKMEIGEAGKWRKMSKEKETHKMPSCNPHLWYLEFVRREQCSEYYLYLLLCLLLPGTSLLAHHHRIVLQSLLRFRTQMLAGLWRYFLTSFFSDYEQGGVLEVRDFERKAKEGNYHQTWETVGENKSLKMNVYKAVLHVFDLKKMTV